jgi:hydrogenase maturation protein HypF
MRVFALCPACQREYDSFADRRFHAQPNACSVCGPRLLLEESSSASSDPLSFAVEALRNGKIVAIKGIGGFQLLLNARNLVALLRLRKRKQREEKPFAVLMPSLDVVKEYCVVSEQEEVLLTSSAAPFCPVATETFRATRFVGCPLVVVSRRNASVLSASRVRAEESPESIG